MSGGGVENHWRLRGGEGYLIIRCFFCFLLFFFVLVYWLRSATNLRF